MYARQLAAFLSQLSAKTDIETRSPVDIDTRFERLRGCGLLPRGRQKNIQHLTNPQIVAGVLSLVSASADYAGVSTISLLKLLPVGGSAHCGFENFGEALESVLLGDKPSFVSMRISTSEFAHNGYCQAELTSVSDIGEKTIYFVGSTMVSVLSPGAEKKFDPKPRSSAMIVETVFFRSFCTQLRVELERDAAWHRIRRTPEPEVDPEEELEEARKEARARYLGLQADSSFLNLSVNGQITWPRAETAVEFEGYRLILLPPLEGKAASVHIDLVASKLDVAPARTLLERFLSLLAWCEDRYAVLRFGWAGNPAPVAVPAPDLHMPTTDWWILSRGVPRDERAKKALALYRQGLTAENSYLVSYAVLSYYKIFELAGDKGHARKAVAAAYDRVKIQSRFDEERIRFENICGARPPAEYLWDFCRSAVAHAIGKKNSSDPDEFDEIQRLHVAADMLRILARHFIQHQIGISESRYE